MKFTLNFIIWQINAKFNKDKLELRSFKYNMGNGKMTTTMIRLKEIYEKKGICLGLGAGVSVDSGIPLWNDLLGIISSNIFNTDKIFNDFLNNRYSSEAFASFLKNSKISKSFPELVREALYGNFKFFKQNIDSSNRRQLVKYVNDNNPTLRSIGSFCAIKKEESETYTSNPNVHGIINFNIDSLLQAYVYAKFEKRILRTVERASAGRMANKINVYHVHGMMRFDLKTTADKESTENLVLAEDEYYDLFNNPANIFNYSFLYLLREYTFLFVGLSMQDLNLRRLLHLSKTEIIDAYKKEQISEGKLRDKIKRKVNKHYAILKRTGHIQSDNFHQHTLINLGVNVIWVDSYSEIQDIFNEIYSTSEMDWKTVF